MLFFSLRSLNGIIFTLSSVFCGTVIRRIMSEFSEGCRDTLPKDFFEEVGKRNSCRTSRVDFLWLASSKQL